MLIYKIVCIHYCTSNAMGWNLSCIIFAIPVSNLPYGCQEHCICMSRCYIYTFWTIMMANNGHYLYMLINTKHLYIGQKTNSKTCLPNGKYGRLSLLGKNMKTSNNPSTINIHITTLKDICVYS
jgi:hypothetical protein